MHNWFDERIFYKECRTLAKNGYSVSLMIPLDHHQEIDGVLFIPIERPSNFINRYFISVLKLFILALKQKANVYHFHDPELITLGFLLKILGKRVIYDVHEDYEEKLKSRLKGPKVVRIIGAKIWWFIESFLSLAFDYIITADSHIDQKFNRKNVVIFPNVPSEEFWIGLQRTKVSDKFRIIYVGSITRDRGILETIESLNHLKHKNVEFHIIGGTEDKQLIEIFEKKPNVVWHGRVEWSKLGEELANADLGVVLLQPVPAYLYYPGENIVKLWEYLSLGLPVLISNFPKLEKLCKDIGFGLAVDPTDPRKIAEAIDYLIDHPEERKIMGANGKRAVVNEYNAENKLKDLLMVYEKILSINNLHGS